MLSESKAEKGESDSVDGEGSVGKDGEEKKAFFEVERAPLLNFR